MKAAQQAQESERKLRKVLRPAAPSSRLSSLALGGGICHRPQLIRTLWLAAPQELENEKARFADMQREESARTAKKIADLEARFQQASDATESSCLLR